MNGEKTTSSRRNNTCKDPEMRHLALKVQSGQRKQQVGRCEAQEEGRGTDRKASHVAVLYCEANWELPGVFRKVCVLEETLQLLCGARPGEGRLME